MNLNKKLYCKQKTNNSELHTKEFMDDKEREKEKGGSLSNAGSFTRPNVLENNS